VRRQDMVRAVRPRLYRRLVLTGGIGVLFLGLLAQRLQSVDADRVVAAMAGLGALPLVLACLATGFSFRAVAGYDQAWHRHLRTAIAPARARRAGFAAIAIGQTVGLGVISGALVRWRMLPELGLLAATQLSVLVAASFLVAWAIVTSLVFWVVPGAPLAGLAPWGLAVAVLGLGAGLAFAGSAMPNLFTLGRLLALAAADCLAAGLALWLLVPGELPLAAFLPAFLLALGAGLVSGSPAGLGAFEIALLALLPDQPEAGLLGAVVAWRVIAYAVPALAGAGLALHSAARRPVPAGAAVPLPEIAEAGLLAQGDLFAHRDGFVAGRTAHGLVALSAVADPRRHRSAARAEGRWPVLYKVGGRGAVAARRAGMRVLPVAREAWLDPVTFRTDIPACAGLRRKLRRAQAAGVNARIEPDPDWPALAQVNAAWVAARGREHGFAMGRFDPAYLASQRIVVARQGAAVTGFASFHVARIGGRQVWTLDLLRPDPQAPEGTGQQMIVAALTAARADGVRKLSLAAVPIGARGEERGPVARLGRALAGDAMRGLDQFKAGFAPRWQRLYIAAPSYPALLAVGAEIWLRVFRPPGLRGTGDPARPTAEYQIAYGRNPWQREEDTLA